MKTHLTFLFLLIFTSLFSQQPQGKWAKVLGGVNSEESQTVFSDDSGNVYVTSLYVSTSTICNTALPAVTQQTVSGNLTQNICITKLDKNGTCLWNVLGISKIRLNNSTVFSPQIRDMKFFNGDIYVCGMFNDSMLFQNARLGATQVQDVVPFVLKLNANGVVQWGRTFETTLQYVSAQALSVDNAGLFVTGYYEDSIRFGNIKVSHYTTSNSYLLRMNHSGNFRWAKNVANDFYNSVGDMCYDGKKNLYITGTYADTTFSGGTYIHKFDTLGTTSWRYAGKAKFGGAMQSQRITYSINDVVYVSGMYTDSVRWGSTSYTTSQNVYKDILVKVNSAGQLQWSKSIGRKNAGQAFEGIVASNKRGPLFFTGFSDTATIGTQTYVSQGNLDNALIQYDEAGTILWKLVFGGSSQELSRDIYSNNGAVYFTSRNMSSYAIANLNVTHSGTGGDALVVKLFDELASDIEDYYARETRTVIYPNPSADKIHVLSDVNISQIIISDLQGKEVIQSYSPENISVQTLDRGIYSCKIFFEDGAEVKKISVVR